MTFLCLKIIFLLVLPTNKGVLCQKLIPGQAELIESNLEKIYQCNFNVLVDCLWKKNGTTTRILPQYYLTNNGKNTLDCSFNATRTDNRPIGYKMECIGIEKPNKTLQHITAFQGKSIELNCSLKPNLKCTWYRNGGVVNVDNKDYKFISNHGTNNCSIKIMKLKTIDAGYWKCGAKESAEFATSGNDIEFHIELKNKAEFLTESSDSSKSRSKTQSNNNLNIEEISSSETTQTTHEEVNPTATVIYATTPSKNMELQTRLIIYLSIAIGVTILLVSAIICLCKRQLKMRNSSVKQSGHSKTKEDQIESNDEPEPIYSNLTSKSETMLSDPEVKASRTTINVSKQFEEKSMPLIHSPPVDVVYTQVEVILNNKNSFRFTNSQPHSESEMTTYATIIHKKLDQKSIQF